MEIIVAQSFVHERLATYNKDILPQDGLEILKIFFGKHFFGTTCIVIFEADSNLPLQNIGSPPV